MLNELKEDEHANMKKRRAGNEIEKMDAKKDMSKDILLEIIVCLIFVNRKTPKIDHLRLLELFVRKFIVISLSPFRFQRLAL